MKKKLVINGIISLNLLFKSLLRSSISGILLRIAITLLIAIASFSSYGQDKIYKKGGEVLAVKIIEVGIDEVKYKMYDEQNGITYALEKDEILKVVYEKGRSDVYLNKLNDPALYADQRHRAIKFNFLSPLVGFSQFTYEQNVKPGQSFEAKLGIIGLGKPLDGESGAFVGAGYKLIKLPNYISRGLRYTHIMQGSYIRPTVAVGFYSVPEQENVNFAALTLDFGKQWVMGDRFLIDIYWGLGYALDNTSNGGYHFAIAGGGESGLGVTSGLRIGMLFK